MTSRRRSLAGITVLVVAVTCVVALRGNAPNGQATIADDLPGVIDGIEVESHDHLPPMVDTNGNLYRVTEDYEAAGNLPRMMKSSDGGFTWAEQDVTRRPTAGDTEAGWALQDRRGIWFAWQTGDEVFLKRFRTSDHGRRPDSYGVRNELVAAPSSPGSAQYVSLAKNAAGSLWVAYATTPSDGSKIGIIKRFAGGRYGRETIIDSGRITTAPRLVEGAHDVTHIFYKDHANDRIYWRTLTTAGVLSPATRVDTGGTHEVETPLTNAVYYDDRGAEVLTVAFADPSGVLRSVQIRDGVVGRERVVSSSPVLIDPPVVTHLAATAHLAVTRRTVHAMWSDAGDGHVFRDRIRRGRAWGVDRLTVHTGAGTARQVQYVYCDVLTGPRGARFLGFTYDLGPHADDDSNIHYDRVRLR